MITLILLGWLYHWVDVLLGQRVNAVIREVVIRISGAYHFLFPGAGEEDIASLIARRAYAQAHIPHIIGVVGGLIILAALVYLTGMFLRGYIGKQAMRSVDRFFERFPGVKAIYPHARQLGDLIFGAKGRRRFSDVVAVEYPRKGIYSLGFMTGAGLRRIQEQSGREMVTVFIPTSPTPLTGFTIIVAREEVLPLDISVDEAFRFCITAGMLVTDVEPRIAAPGAGAPPLEQ